MSEISFLSSAGVGLLVAFHKKLKAIGGSFAVTSPSDRVKEILDLCKLSPILLSAGKPAVAPAQKIEVRRFSTPAASFEVMDLVSRKPLVCHRIGDPELLKGCRFAPADCRKVAFPEATFGFGLGAFGDGFEDSQTRFGEFLAVDGSAAYLPTDGTNVPDFMVSSGDLVPEMNVLYGLRWEGGFTHLLRFETSSAENPLATRGISTDRIGDFRRAGNRNGDRCGIGGIGWRRSSPFSRCGCGNRTRPVSIS